MFTESVLGILDRARITPRAKTMITDAVLDEDRSVAAVATEYRVPGTGILSDPNDPNSLNYRKAGNSGRTTIHPDRQGLINPRTEPDRQQTTVAVLVVTDILRASTYCVETMNI